MKSILINAQTQELSEINLNKELVLEETYAAIGNSCQRVETACYLNDTEIIVVDEEGYFKENLKGFYLDGVGFYYGNGVVWNCDENGESTDCETSIESLKSRIVWVDEATSQHIRLRVLENPTIDFHVLDSNSEK